MSEEKGGKGERKRYINYVVPVFLKTLTQEWVGLLAREHSVPIVLLYASPTLCRQARTMLSP